MSWFLRKKNGDEYGPVELNELQEWAHDGRIEPDDAISADREIWNPAPTLAALGMEWMVELPEAGGMYGPVNLLAARELLLTQAISPQARVVHKITGEEGVLIERLFAVVDAQKDEWRSTVDALRADLGAARGQVEELRSQIDTSTQTAAAGEKLENELVLLAGQKESFHQDAEKWKNLNDEANAALKKAEAQAGALQRKLDEAAAQKAAIETERDTLKKQIEEAGAVAAQAKDQSSGMEDEIATLKARIEKLQSQTDEIQQAREDKRKAELDLEQARRQVEEQTMIQEHEKSRIEQARAELEEELKKLTAERNGLQSEGQRLAAALQEAQAAFQGANDRLTGLDRDMKAAAAQKESIVADMKNLKRLFDEERSVSIQQKEHIQQLENQMAALQKAKDEAEAAGREIRMKAEEEKDPLLQEIRKWKKLHEEQQALWAKEKEVLEKARESVPSDAIPKAQFEEAEKRIALLERSLKNVMAMDIKGPKSTQVARRHAQALEKSIKRMFRVSAQVVPTLRRGF